MDSLTIENVDFRSWFEENLSENATDIAQYGADAGYGGITYYEECVELYNHFETEIWDMLTEESENFGYKNPMEFVATFNRSDMTNDPDQFKNLLVWYACERVAREIVDEQEEQS